jgi:hypothetical protein
MRNLLADFAGIVGWGQAVLLLAAFAIIYRVCFSHSKLTFGAFIHGLLKNIGVAICFVNFPFRNNPKILLQSIIL